MGNNMNCDVCSGNPRNQMDMRRQRPVMNDRYARGQMMPRTQNACDECVNTRMPNSCDDCNRSKRDELKGMPLAMGYVPWQNFECTYEPMEGFHAGTIFPELDKPFYGRRGMR